MQCAVARQSTDNWLISSGLKELELLFGSILYYPSQPLLLTDSDRICLDVSAGACKLLGLTRDKIIGRRIDDFAEPSFRFQMERLWRDFLGRGEQEGVFELAAADGRPRRVEYIGKGNVLPARHLVFLRARTKKKGTDVSPRIDEDQGPQWEKDYALFLLEMDGRVAAWYSGAERVYGYKRDVIVGRQLSDLYPDEADLPVKLEGELKRAAVEGHFGSDGWHQKQDGSRFWADVLTMALKDESGRLRGFARVVRAAREGLGSDGKLPRSDSHPKPRQSRSTIAGIVSGEFDRVIEASDSFLAMVGYTREELEAGELNWLDITAPEFLASDEHAHQESLRYGACTPFEKEFIRKDGSRALALVTRSVLSLSPFRWITFVQDLTERGQREMVGEEAGVEPKCSEIVGDSAALRRVLGLMEIVAPTDATVLILGETGTGKELVARAIHKMSPRHARPFVTLNCAAIPTGLLESELFGYERGAFTSALSQKIGRFEMANQGTLFLDEVGDIPIDLQPKLLRALQEKEFERLGGTRTIPIDVRLLAATNRNLTQMMGDKLFRSDLYYRLKVFPITTSPLRDHPEDIPLLARHFIQKYATQMGKRIETIPTSTIQALTSWSWPGNVRELENFIERSVILSPGPTLCAPLAEIRENQPDVASRGTLEEVEREYILRVFKESGGVVSETATRLGLPRTSLNAMMRKLGISRDKL